MRAQALWKQPLASCVFVVLLTLDSAAETAATPSAPSAPVVPPTAPPAATQPAAPRTVNIIRNTSAKIPYGTTTLLAGVGGLEVVGPPTGGQLRVRYLGQILTVPVVNTDYPVSGAPPPQTVATAPAAPPKAVTPLAPATPAGTPAQDDLRNIPTRTIEQIVADQAQLSGKVVSFTFRFRGKKVDQKEGELEGEIIEYVEERAQIGAKKTKKRLALTARMPREAANWFNRVPVKTAGEDGTPTHVFGRVSSGAKGKLLLELLGNEKRTDTSGSRIVWSGS